MKRGAGHLQEHTTALGTGVVRLSPSVNRPQHTHIASNGSTQVGLLPSPPLSIVRRPGCYSVWVSLEVPWSSRPIP
jgi:hypothetical protein